MRPTKLTAMVLACGLACGAQAQLMVDDDDAPATTPAVQPPTQPTTEPTTEPKPEPATVAPEDDKMITLPAFSEPWQLEAIVDWVGAELGINIIKPTGLDGSISLSAPYAFPKSKLMRFLDGVLGQYGYTITYDADTGFYVVQLVSQVPPMFEGEQATTVVIRTPNVKPSLLLPAINRTIDPNSPPVAPNTAPTGPVTAIDELGVLVVTSSPRTIRTVRQVVDELLKQRAMLKIHRIELDHIAASVARDRLLGLAGGDENDDIRRNAAAGGRNGAAGAATGTVSIGGASLSNLGDRLTVDAQGNALLFKGTPEELGELRDLILLIDIPNMLAPKSYFAGSSAQQVADMASRLGLGEVVVLESSGNSSDPYESAVRRAIQQQNTATPTIGGPVMVVDPDRGSIIYYGTSSQHAQLQALLDNVGAEDERVVIRTYVLEHQQAEDVADTLDSIISGRQRTGESALLPGTTGGGFTGSGATIRRDVTPVVQPDGSVEFQNGSGDDVSAAFDPDEVIVVPDVPNNQIIVRAPVRQQEELGRLIDKLDLRRPQVYIEAIIVSVSDTRDFNLAVETQILNGQYGVQTAFGLSSASTDGFQGQRTVSPTLGGLTAALVQSESIPFIINAMQTDTDARIVSRPSLLVNNNEEASIVSLDQQPVTETSQGETTTTTSFGGFQDAGTTLNVLPTISEGGYLRLEFTVELSSFTGAGSDGIPSPRTEQQVESVVTVPSDAAIVVGGIRVKNDADTIVKIPLLGDIPLIGHAFRNTNKLSTDSVFYIFITPKIMTDPNFRDLKLESYGPQAEVELDEDVPELVPLVIPIHTGRNAAPAPDGAE